MRLSLVLVLLAACGGNVCPTGLSPCGSYCYELSSDDQNCGACGQLCGGGRRCVESSCVTLGSGGGAGGGGGSGGGAAGGGMPMSRFPEPPQVLASGGPLLKRPKIVSVLFANDGDPTVSVADIKAFYSGIGTSQYWAGLAEYGVAAPTVTFVDLAESAPSALDDAQIQSWLVASVDAGRLPGDDANTLYALNYPKGTTVTDSDGTVGCTDWYGYHNAVDDAGYAYAIVPRCTPDFVYTKTALDMLTDSASHELVESVTDPYLSPGYYYVDDAHAFWETAGGAGEIADMCDAEDSNEVGHRFSDFPYVVERWWSNAAAKAGHDPCFPPIPGRVYFAAAPVLREKSTFKTSDRTVQALSVHIAVGASATVPLQLYSDGVLGQDWNVAVYDFNDWYNGGAALLTFGLSSATGNDGATVMLTIHVVTRGGSGNSESPGTEIFVVESTVGTGPTAIVHDWYGLVGS